jgi:hypothetical protein
MNTYRLNRIPPDERSALAEASTCTTHIYKRQASMPPNGFEPDIPKIKWSQAYALDHEETAISIYVHPWIKPFTELNN